MRNAHEGLGDRCIPSTILSMLACCNHASVTRPLGHEGIAASVAGERPRQAPVEPRAAEDALASRSRTKTPACWSASAASGRNDQKTWKTWVSAA